MSKIEQIVSRIESIFGSGSGIEKLKISKVAYQKQKERGTIPWKELANIANENDLSLSWLAFGKGNQKITSSSIEGNLNNINGNQTITITIGESSKEELREISEIVKILEGLPEKSIKKLYHLAELEKLENQK